MTARRGAKSRGYQGTLCVCVCVHCEKMLHRVSNSPLSKGPKVGPTNTREPCAIVGGLWPSGVEAVRVNTSSPDLIRAANHSSARQASRSKVLRTLFVCAWSRLPQVRWTTFTRLCSSNFPRRTRQQDNPTHTTCGLTCKLVGLVIVTTTKHVAHLSSQKILTVRKGLEMLTRGAKPAPLLSAHPSSARHALRKQTCNLLSASARPEGLKHWASYGELTLTERLEHEFSHLPCRPWCEVCVRSMSKRTKSRRLSLNAADGV